MRTNIRQDIVLTSTHMPSAACFCCNVGVASVVMRTSITITFNKLWFIMHGNVNIKRKINQIIELLLFFHEFSQLPLKENCEKHIESRIYDHEQKWIVISSFDSEMILFDKMHHCNTDQKQWCHYTYTEHWSCIITAADDVQSILSSDKTNLVYRLNKTKIPRRRTIYTIGKQRVIQIKNNFSHSNKS